MEIQGWNRAQEWLTWRSSAICTTRYAGGCGAELRALARERKIRRGILNYGKNTTCWENGASVEAKTHPDYDAINRLSKVRDICSWRGCGTAGDTDDAGDSGRFEGTATGSVCTRRL